MDTPPMIRGQLYSTHLTLRCPNYKQCQRCKMCSSYSVHNPLCGVCEGSKPSGRHHECTVKQVESLITIESMLGRPMYDINATPKDVVVDVCTTSFESENAMMINRIKENEEEAYRIHHR